MPCQIMSVMEKERWWAYSIFNKFGSEINSSSHEILQESQGQSECSFSQRKYEYEEFSSHLTQQHFRDLYVHSTPAPLALQHPLLHLPKPLQGGEW